MGSATRSNRAQPVFRAAVLAAVVCLTILVVPSPGGAVIGGEEDGTRHPYVGAQDNRHCGVGLGSGVLVSPTVFLIAGHGAHFCLDRGINRSRVTFDPVVTESSTFYDGTVYAHPDYAGFAKANDVGVLVLDQPVGITPAQLGGEGFLDDLGPEGLRDQIFTTVGYGTQRVTGGRDGGGPPTPDRASRGTRKLVHEQFLSLAGDKLHLQMHEDGSTCTGDSGAPSLFGESDLIAGISVGGDGRCRNMDEHQRLDTPAVRAFLDDFMTLP